MSTTNPFIKNYLVTLDYGDGNKHCFVFMKSTKVKIMDYLSKRGMVGEAVRKIEFVELGVTKDENTFWFTLSADKEEE